MSCGRECRTAAVAILMLWSAVDAPSSAAGPDAEHLALEPSYRRALHDWATGNADAAVAAYSDAQHAAAEWLHGGALDLESVEVRRLPSGEREISGLPDQQIRCVLGVERHTLELLETQAAEHLLTAAIFHLEVYLDQMTRRPRPWLEKTNRRHMDALFDRYAEIAERDLAGGQRVEALSRIYLAAMVAGAAEVALGWSVPMKRGIASFRRARGIDPGALTPRYWTALVYEKLADYGLVDVELRSLAADYPASAEIRLRLARNLVRQGRDEASRLAYRTLLGAPGARRNRILAYQELASLLADQRDGWQEAVAVLRRGIEEFPENQRLRIELSYLLADRAFGGEVEAAHATALLAESESLAEAVLDAGAVGDDQGAGAASSLADAMSVRGTPRLRYELPDPALVGPELELAGRSIVEWKAELRAALDTLGSRNLAEPKCLQRLSDRR